MKNWSKDLTKDQAQMIIGRQLTIGRIVYETVENKLTLKEIADKYEMDESVVRHTAKKYGVGINKVSW